jgi:hypothetical protein
MNRQLFDILCYYLNSTGIIYSQSKLKRLVATHPDKNSFYTIADVFDELHIQNATFRLDMNNLKANGFPAIVHTKENEGTFIVINDIADGKIHYYHSKTGHAVTSSEEFAAIWSGYALYAAQDEIRLELENKKSSSSQRLLKWRAPLSVFAGLLCVGAWGFAAVWSVTSVCLFALCALGLLVSVLLTMHEFGEDNQLIHKVCHLNRMTNCNVVLGSSAAKLFGWLSMSDIGLCYFTGSALSLFFAGVTPYYYSVVSWLFVIALCSFPYTIFSLWYQLKKLKKVCPMCLMVIGVLWAEITLAISNWSSLQLFPVSFTTMFSLCAGFTLPIFTWTYVKPLWKEYFRVRNYEYLYLRLKRTPDVIRAMIAQKQPVEMNYSSDEIHLGKLDAPIHLTVVFSFFCKPCAEGWHVLNRLLSAYYDVLYVTVRFFGYHLLGENMNELIDALTEINNKSGNDAFRDALTGWFEDKDISIWKSKYFANKSASPQLSSEKNAYWIRENSIYGMPAVYVDDRELPFELEDLECLLREIHDSVSI